MLNVRVRLYLSVIALMLLEPSGPVRIEVRPQIVQFGAPIRIRCYVQPDSENRWVDIGVQGVSVSRVQLDGDSSVVQERTVKESPCDDQIAFCVLTQTQNRELRVTQLFRVACSAF